MMENAGADDLIERRPKFRHTIDGKLMDLKIGQAIFALERLRPLHTRCADVDTGDLGCRPAKRMLRRLGCSTARDEDGVVFFVRFGRPKEVIVSPALSRVLPCAAILIQTFDRWRIRVAVIEVLDLLFHIKEW